VRLPPGMSGGSMFTVAELPMESRVIDGMVGGPAGNYVIFQVSVHGMYIGLFGMYIGLHAVSLYFD
jgi:hypothetical protein